MLQILLLSGLEIRSREVYNINESKSMKKKTEIYGYDNDSILSVSFRRKNVYK